MSCGLEPLRAQSLRYFRQLEWQVQSCKAELLGVYFSEEAFHAAASEFGGQLDANVWRDPRTGERTYTLWRYPPDEMRCGEKGAATMTATAEAREKRARRR